jgi:hypothetical protein
VPHGLDEQDGRDQNIFVEDEEGDASRNAVRHVTTQGLVHRDFDDIVEDMKGGPEIRARRVAVGETD